MEAQGSGKLPSQAINPRENASAVTLRRGKFFKGAPRKMKDQVEESCEKDEATAPTVGSKVESKSSISTYVPSPPFFGRFAKSKKDEHEKEILETFHKVQVNIPLLDAIYQVPRYAKFLKDLCTNKHRLKGNEVVSIRENISAVLQKKLPPKYKDPGSFTILCIFGNTRFENAMLDLGASINVMPYSIYASLNLGSLKETGVIIQLADRSNAFPKGVLEDVLVQIDVHDGTLTMEFDGEIIRFNIFKAMRYPSDLHACFSIDIIDSLVQKVFELSNEDALDNTLIKGIDANNLTGLSKNLQVCKDVEIVASLESLPSIPPRYDISYITLPISKEKFLPSMMQAPTLELKPLPEHLKYVYLGEEKTLSVIIAKNLTTPQENRLIRVLKEHKIAIGWTIADIKGISPAMGMHRILLEDEAKPSREAQRRLNPPMMEVVKKEILKLLDIGVIFPISDSKWVSSVQVVPKKSGITVVTNEENELVPTQVQMGWKVNRLLQKGVPFYFDEDRKKVFESLKELLTSAPIIQPPDWNRLFELMCDASDFTLGAVLGKRVGKILHVIYYASRTLNDAQFNYSTTEKEILAVIFALEKFRSYLIGTKVTVFFYHATLRYLLAKKEAKSTLIRWILLLQEFDLEIKDKKGSENSVAGHLSRLSHERETVPLQESFPDKQLLLVTDRHVLGLRI
ncbi:uncharacterized protein LOC111386743 [Olea europaea var. sylvestris]|uniref:uncharacterized protein LOC111386743 n=1 Tax=Olea europaea var. sylvestris TaxID=158386 RepID=UPI000C1CDB98|nr:uncharacterized protein LOC111386743 [Olea europaea var. sylvestris]